jgi:biotin operon repressor
MNKLSKEQAALEFLRKNFKDLAMLSTKDIADKFELSRYRISKMIRHVRDNG